jgi:hypothetical protein
MDEDWAQAAADEVLADLLERGGVMVPLLKIKNSDAEIWQEIRAELAQIIRAKAPVARDPA